MRCRLAVTFAIAGCHIVTREPITRPIASERVRHPEGAIAGRPELVLSDAGALRFVEPLECPTEEVVRASTATEVAIKPNLATFIVGVIASGAGFVLVVRGASEASPGSSPYLYAGGGLLAGGVPFAIGPWLGTRAILEPGVDAAPTRRAGPSEPCGDRPLAAHAATLAIHGVEVRGRIDRDGVLSVSPYELVDAFEPTNVPPLAIHATIDADGGPRTLDVVIGGGALATHAKAFLDRAAFDARIEPMRLVPGLTAGALRASLTSTAGGPAIRIVLPIENHGPGPAWAVRGHLVAPGTPALDGRILYAGAIAKGEVKELAGMIAVTDAAAAQLRNATIELAVELRDAHGTAPTTPVRLRGAILVDAPR